MALFYQRGLFSKPSQQSAQNTSDISDLKSRTAALETGPLRSDLQAALDSKATQTYVDARVAALVASSPTTLDTLKELADALGNDPNFATTITTSLGTKATTASVTALTTRVTAVENSLLNKASTTVTDSLATRMTAAESAISSMTSQETRIVSLESWRSAKASYLGAPLAADLTTNYNVVTTLLGALVGAMNVTNAKVNAIISGKLTPLQSGLQTREIFASS